MKLLKIMNVAFLLCASTNVIAQEWHVDNDNSHLNFISVKKANIAESHQFTDLNGSLDSTGKFVLSIDLESVDTRNPIRDDRMKKFLFDTKQYSHAQLTAKIEDDVLNTLVEGTSKQLTIVSLLSLHGVEKSIPIDVIVTRLVGNKLSVSSLKPVIIQAKDFSLVTGLDKLRELASLPSISQAVPVSFYLTLDLIK